MKKSGVIAQVRSVELVQRGIRRVVETVAPCEWRQLSWNLFCDEREASAIQTEQAWYDQSETFGPQRVQGYSEQAVGETGLKQMCQREENCNNQAVIQL